MKKLMSSCLIIAFSVSSGFTQSNCLTPTSLQLQYAYDTQVGIEWDEMSSPSDSVNSYRIRYRPVGESVWKMKRKNYQGNQTPKVKTRLKNLIPNLMYEMKIKAVYHSGCVSPFSAIRVFMTNTVCPNVGHFSVETPQTTRAVFSWDILDQYSFVRIKARRDVSGSPWFNVGGFGVLFPIASKAKNGLIPGQDYRGQSRTWCNPTGGIYKSSSWTSLIFWTQPSSNNGNRLGGGVSIDNFEVYPNPSLGSFNISFTSEEVQQLKVNVVNLVGEIIISENLEQFSGEYTKQIDLTDNAKGIYLVKIETESGVINKKLILQ